MDRALEVNGPRHLISADDTVVQPSSFPTRKVATFGGVQLLLFQVFDVLTGYGVRFPDAVRELGITLAGLVAAWWVKERGGSGVNE